jgi:hypothetical protein
VTAVLLDGTSVAAAILGTNDSLGYGRFDAPGLEVHRYEFSASADEIILALSSAFAALVAEMKVDDLLDGEPSALMRMGYPTLREAFHWPRELREVVEVFLHNEILVAFMPFTDQSDFVINSTDEIHINESGLRLLGRCFRRRRP